MLINLLFPQECQELLEAKFSPMDVADAMSYAQLKGKIKRSPKW